MAPIIYPTIQEWRESSGGLLPAIGGLLCLVAMGWTVVWGIQMQMARTFAGQPPIDMTNYWFALGTISLLLVSMLMWSNRLVRPSAAQVCIKRRPRLESEVERLALRQLMRIESRL
jgi:hypothetical protein